VDHVDERHRHRYEVNPDFTKDLEKSGMLFPGQSEDGNRMEVLELQSHPYYVGVQYHPEYLSRPLKPSAPFVGLVLAASNKLRSYVDHMSPNGAPKTPQTSSLNHKKYFYLNTFDESSAQLNKISENGSVHSD
jgi:hypothetical protein